MASRWNNSVCKQTGVDKVNLVQLIAPIHPVAWNAVSAKSTCCGTIKLDIVNARSVCNKTDVLTEVNMDLVAIMETWLSAGDCPPPSKKNKQSFADFLAEFAGFAEHYALMTCRLAIVGDFNIHWCRQHCETFRQPTSVS